MAVDPRSLTTFAIPPKRHAYTGRDCLLYALGVGCGLDPGQMEEACWLDLHRPQTLPSMATILGYDGLWGSWCPPGLELIDLIHVSQSLTVHHPLPYFGEVERRSRISDVVDKGPGKALLVQTKDVISDIVTGQVWAELESIVYCRGSGGGGGTRAGFPAGPDMPDRPPDSIHPVPTGTQQARIYSLSGDENPLHWDRATAAASGFDQPILQGLSLYGAACAALLRVGCGKDPIELRDYSARFTSPAFPGDQLDLHLWRMESASLRFRLVNRTRGTVALDHGLLRWETSDD